MANTIDLGNNVSVYINRDATDRDGNDEICAAVFKDREPVEFYRLRSGHLALRWSDERVAKYLFDKTFKENDHAVHSSLPGEAVDSREGTPDGVE
jgi:hypothetical protein